VDMPLRVLLVEDSADDADLLLRALRKGSYLPAWLRVESAEALESALAGQAWDVVIADYILPRFSGVAALQLLRQTGLDLPFIIVSGKVGEERAVEAMRAGAHDFLLKDHLERLVPAIQRELHEAEVRREWARAEADLRKAKSRAEEDRSRWESIFEAIGDGISVQDTDFRILYQNKAQKQLMGEHLGEYCYSAYQGRKTVCDGCHLAQAFRDGRIYKVESSSPAGSGKLAVEITASPLRDQGGAIVGGIEVVRDISARKEAEEKMRYMSSHDILTGLYNRAYFEEEMARLERGRTQAVSIIMADMDGLKEVNDSRGHAAGDRSLQEAARIFKSVFRAEDMVARIGGDEFAVLLPDSDAAAVEIIMERIRTTLAAHNGSPKEVPLSLSFGAATAENGMTLVEVLKLADERMYRAKFARAG